MSVRCEGTPRAAALLLLALLVAASARADAPAPPPSPAAPAAATPASEDLQSPAHRSTRYSAYSLAPNTWSIDVGVLGVSGDELYGRLGAAVGFKHGLQLDVNIAHWAAGLFGLNLKWSFFEARHAALAASLGVMYAHGAWVWILEDFGQQAVSDSDMLALPLAMELSVPCTRWLQFDLSAQYQHSQLWGSIGDGATFYADTQFGARQLLLRPTLRLFLTEMTAFEFTSRLPVYNRVPYESDSTIAIGAGYGRSRDGYASIDFSKGWTLEFGLRSRMRHWLFVTTRLHVGQIAERVYGAIVYPSFSLEFRIP